MAALAVLSPLLLLIAAQVLPDAAFSLAMGVNAASVLVTGVAMVVAARRGDPRLRRPRLWFAAALGASAAGFATAGLHAVVVDEIPVVSLANLAPLVWVPCALAGMLAIPTERHREGGRPRAVLDAVVVTAALGMLFWMLFLEAIYGATDRSGLAKLVLLGYPVVDLVIAVVAFSLAAQARGDLRRFLRLVAGGLLLVAAADAGSAAALAAGEPGFGWTNVVAQSGLAVLLCAAVLPTGAEAHDRRRFGAAVDAALPLAPLVLAVAVVLQRQLTGHGPDGVVVALGSIMVLGLVCRQALFATHLGAVAHRLSLDAASDPLTGLANRRSCLDAIEIALAEREPGDVAVVLLDLDGFKEINDTFGHAAGDAALSAFAARMRTVVSGSALVARLGGDEFAVVVTGDDAQARALRSAGTLTAVATSTVGALTLSVGASAGVAVSRRGDTTSAILRRADLAMYEAKRSGESVAALFSDAMALRAERRHLLTQSIPGAAGRGELELVYQPLFRLDDGSVAAAEALLRWRSPVHGDVPPTEFVPLAEESGAIVDLGCWVLSRAAAQLEEWTAAGRVLPRLSVNVSVRQLTEAFAEEAVRRVLERGVDPSYVTLEITESAMPDLPANRCIEQLREAGFAIAMDDFGAGFSSLAQLGVLPVDTLKFDRELIRGVATPNGRRIVESVITLAGDLGLVTVAEGVETDAELQVVRQAGCALGQGFHLSRPVSAQDMGLLLETGMRVGLPVVTRR